MAGCERGYLCTVCGGEVEELPESSCICDMSWARSPGRCCIAFRSGTFAATRYSLSSSCTTALRPSSRRVHSPRPISTPNTCVLRNCE